MASDGAGGGHNGVAAATAAKVAVAAFAAGVVVGFQLNRRVREKLERWLKDVHSRF